MTDWGTSWSSDGFKSRTTLPDNPCRDLVEVPGGPEWKIRELISSQPQYCWKYAETSVIVQYHFDLLNKERNETIIDRAGSMPRLPVFYGVLPFFVSPTEISVQPKYLEKVRQQMTERMNEAYSDDNHQFGELEIFAPIACICKIGDEIFRARVRNLSGHSFVNVELIDYGNDKLVHSSMLRPLLARFGKLPPLSLRCKVKDVYVNDLDTEKVNLFKKMLEDCNFLIRVELCNSVEPYQINIFHPTVHDYNLGTVFYRRESDAQREERKWEKWEAHVKRQNCEDDSDFENGDGDGEYEDEATSGEEEDFYIFSFDKIPRAVRELNRIVCISHVENVRLIYVQGEWMVTERDKINEELKAQWSTLPSLPDFWQVPGCACAVQHDGQFLRATIVNNNNNKVDLFTVDRGLTLTSYDVDQLKLMPNSDVFTQAPLLYAISLPEVKEYFPHPGQTEILRQLLPDGAKVEFQADRKHKKLPCRGSIIILDGNVDVLTELTTRLSESRIDVRCTDLLPFNRYLADGRSINVNYQHRLYCPEIVVKSNFQLLAI